MTSSGSPTSGEGIRAHHNPYSCGGANPQELEHKSFHVCLRATVGGKHQYSIAIGYLVVRLKL